MRIFILILITSALKLNCSNAKYTEAYGQYKNRLFLVMEVEMCFRQLSMHQTEYAHVHLVNQIKFY